MRGCQNWNVTKTVVTSFSTTQSNKNTAWAKSKWNYRDTVKYFDVYRTLDIHPHSYTPCDMDMNKRQRYATQAFIKIDMRH